MTNYVLKCKAKSISIQWEKFEEGQYINPNEKPTGDINKAWIFHTKKSIRDYFDYCDEIATLGRIFDIVEIDVKEKRKQKGRK